MILGIDPGLKGGLCLRHDDHRLTVCPMPVVGDAIDSQFLEHHIKDNNVRLVVIEKQSYRPGQAGVVTNLSNYGRLLGVCEVIGVRVEIVDPKKWKKVVLGDKHPHDKGGAIQFCSDNYPDTNLILPRCRTPHDGIADSICIAHYGALL